MSDQEWCEWSECECEDTLARTYQPLPETEAVEPETERSPDPWGLWS
jgi:hypothetical protein